MKDHKFASLVYDLGSARVLWAGLGKGRETIDRFFIEALSKGQKTRILWVSSSVRCEITSIIPSLSPIAIRPTPSVKALTVLLKSYKPAPPDIKFDSFSDMIYLTIDDLDIPAHIPSHLRTL